MHDRGSHHVLQQLPLTVSPFVALPAATTLPYTYASLPVALPAPSTSGGYVKSPSGNLSTTPEAIIQSCHALIQHLQSQRMNAEQEIRNWEKAIEDRELMEKRKVAPGYLDTGLRILEPIRKDAPLSTGLPARDNGAPAREPAEVGSPEGKAGEELDRAFGKLGV